MTEFRNSEDGSRPVFVTHWQYDRMIEDAMAEGAVDPHAFVLNEARRFGFNSIEFYDEFA